MRCQEQIGAGQSHPITLGHVPRLICKAEGGRGNRQIFVSVNNCCEQPVLWAYRLLSVAPYFLLKLAVGGLELCLCMLQFFFLMTFKYSIILFNDVLL